MTTSDTIKILAHNITRYRKSAHLSQERLAEMSNISVGYLSKLERSIIENVSITILMKIANALHVTINDLVYDNKQSLDPNLNQKRLNQLLNEMDDKTSEKLSQSLINTISILTNNK